MADGDVVVDFVIFVVNVVVVALIVVTGQTTVIFVSNPTTVFRLCCGCVMMSLAR